MCIKISILSGLFIARFYTFVTASGHQISLTDLHLIPIISSNGKFDYIAAKEVKLDDQFYVLINGQLEYSPVRNITIELKTGYFAPLTMTGSLLNIYIIKIFLFNLGTILVNNVYASCFASVNNHQLAQMFMAPFRWYYQLVNLISLTDPFNNNRTDGIHWFVKLIYEFAAYFQPSALQLS